MNLKIYNKDTFALGKLIESPKKKIRKFTTRRLFDLTIVILILLIVILIYFISVNTVFRNLVLPNVRANNVDVSLLSSTNLTNNYISNYKGLLGHSLNVNLDNQIYKVNLNDIDLKVDDNKLINYGKGPDLLNVLNDGVTLLKGKNFNASYTIDSKALLNKSPINFYSSNSSYISTDNKLFCILGNTIKSINK